MAEVDLAQLRQAASLPIEGAVRLSCLLHDIHLLEVAYSGLTDGFDELWEMMSERERLTWLSGFISGAQAQQAIQSNVDDILEQKAAEEIESMMDSVFAFDD